MTPLISFGVDIIISIIIMIFLTVENSSVVVKISVMVIVICGIINTLYRAPKCLVL